MPMLCPKFVRDSFLEDIEREVTLLTSTNDSKPPKKFFIHVYSNNGALDYSHLIKRNKIPIAQKLIIDSAPKLNYSRNPTSEAKDLSILFTTVISNGTAYYKFPFTPLMNAFLFLQLHFSVITDKLIPTFKNKYFVNYVDSHTYLRDHTPIIPTLFIYSLGDRLIKPEGMQNNLFCKTFLCCFLYYYLYLFILHYYI
jgi:hypothetical protein